MLLSAGVLTVVVRIALSVGSLRRVIRALRRAARGLPQWSDSTSVRRERAAWAASAVGRRLLQKGPCLTQAIVLQYLLRRQGDKAARLRIGVARGRDDTLQAHAWVERKGEVLIGGAASQATYIQFDDLEEKLTI